MSAYAVLGVMGGQDTVAALRVRLGDDDENVRRAAVEALATTGDVDAVRRLLEMLDEEEDESPTPRGKTKHWHLFHIVARRAP